MSNGRPYRRSIFSGLLLILLGGLFLLHNFRGDFPIWDLFSRWWPLLLILWGLAKLYDHLAAQRTGQAAPSAITGGDIFLVLLLVALVGTVGGYDWFRRHGDAGEIWIPPWEHSYSFSEELPAKGVPADSRITIRTDRGDITVTPQEAPEIRVTAKKSLSGSTESDAQRRAQRVTVAIAEVSGGYEVRPEGQTERGGRPEVNLEVHVPKQASVMARTERGSLQIAGLAGSVAADVKRGSIELRDVGGDVNAEIKRGDVHILGAQGNVKISGRGGEVEISDVKGEAALDGEFYGPIRIEKVAKGVRFVSRRTDLTVSQLSGRIETGSGRMEISDAPGHVSLVTRKYDVVLEQIGGRVQVENRDGNVELRLPQPPREPVEITTQSGNIELVLPAKASFEVNAEARSGDIECEFDDPDLKVTQDHGGSRLAGKRGARGPQIRLKTSYGTIRLRKGES